MSGPGLEIRGCRSREELEQVVELCDEAFPKTPREYFERHILKDHTLTLSDTRVLVKGRTIVSSVQVFPRALAWKGQLVGMGGIGNVATLPPEREKGYAGMVLRDAIGYLREKRFSFSLLTTTINPYYERFGYHTIKRRFVVRDLQEARHSAQIRMFNRNQDLARVMEIYEQFNAGRVGPIVRNEDYWRSQLEFCGEERSLFLVYESGDELVGFIRARRDADAVRVLEYACTPGSPGVIPSLFEHVACEAGLNRLHLFTSDSEKVSLSFGESDRVQTDTDLMVNFLDPSLDTEFKEGLQSDYQLTFWLTDLF